MQGIGTIEILLCTFPTVTVRQSMTGRTMTRTGNGRRERKRRSGTGQPAILQLYYVPFMILLRFVRISLVGCTHSEEVRHETNTVDPVLHAVARCLPAHAGGGGDPQQGALTTVFLS